MRDHCKARDLFTKHLSIDFLKPLRRTSILNMLVPENFEWIPCLPAGTCLCILAWLQQEATCDSSQVRSRKTPCQRLVCAKGLLCKEHSILLRCPVAGKSAQTTGTGPRRPSELQNDKWKSVRFKLVSYFILGKMCKFSKYKL